MPVPDGLIFGAHKTEVLNVIDQLVDKPAEQPGNDRGFETRNAGDGRCGDEKRNRINLSAHHRIAKSVTIESEALGLRGLERQSVGKLTEDRSHSEDKDVFAAPRSRRIAIGRDLPMVAVNMKGRE